jgi:hypothetical protein
VDVAAIIERLRVGLDARNASDLASRIGVTPGAITNWRGSGRVGVETVVEAARSAGLSLSWVFDGIGPMRLGETMLPATTPESAPTTERPHRDKEREAAAMAMFGRSLDAGIEPLPGRGAEAGRSVAPGDTMASLTPAQLATLGHEVIDLLVRHATGHTTGNQ